MPAEFGGPAPPSLLSWFFHALGVQYTILLPLAGLLSFVLALALVLRGRGPMATAALLLAVALPLLVGVYGALDGAIMSFIVIARSSVTPKPSEVAQGVAMSLVTPMAGTWAMAPAFLVAVVGSLVRSLRDKP